MADFIGKMNMLPGTRVETQGAFSTYRLDGGIIVSAPGNAERVTLAVRPEAVRVGTPLPGANVLLGKVEYRAFLGELIEIGLSLPNGALFVVRGIELDGVAVDRGDDLTVWWTADKTTVLDPD